MDENEKDEGWVDPISCNDWSLFDAAQEIENEAYRLAAEQLQYETPPNQEHFQNLLLYYKRMMWELAERLLKGEYPCVDLENFSYQLQYFAIEGPEDPDDPDQYPEPEIVEDDEAEPSREASDSAPSADELKGWLD